MDKPEFVEILPNNLPQQNVIVEFYPMKILKSSITVKNKQNSIVIFKMRTTNPKHTTVKPNCGFLHPNSEIKLDLNLSAMPKLDEPIKIIKDKLEIQVVELEESPEDIDISNYFKSKPKDKPTQIQQIKIQLQNVSNSSNNSSQLRESKNNSQLLNQQAPKRNSFLKEQVYSVKSNFTNSSQDFKKIADQNLKNNNNTNDNQNQSQTKFKEKTQNNNNNVNPKQQYEELKAQIQYRQTEITLYENQLDQLKKINTIHKQKIKENENELEDIQNNQGNFKNHSSGSFTKNLIIYGVFLQVGLVAGVVFKSYF